MGEAPVAIANHHASLPIAYRLYLPEGWANDAERRGQAHVPEEVEFRTKPQIALAQIEAAMKDGVAGGVVLADAGYGSDGAFRAGVIRNGSGSRSARRRSARENSARVRRRQLPSLWSAQSVAAVAAGGRGRRAMHSGAPDARRVCRGLCGASG